MTGRNMGPTRCIRNKLTEQILEAEKKGATPMELFELIGTGRSERATMNGDVEEGTIYCGQIAGLLTELKSAEEVINEIIEGAGVLIKELGRYTQ